MSEDQETFKRIILHNHLLSDMEVEVLLKKTPDPEQAIAKMLETMVLTEKKAGQLLAMYRKKVGKPETPPKTTDTEAPAVAKTKASPEAPNRSAVETPKQDHGPSAAKISISSKAAECRGAELIQELMKRARETNASDLHIKSEMAPAARIVGVLRAFDMPALPADVCQEALLAILNEEQRRQFHDEKDLDFCFDAGAELGRFRANLLQQHRGTDGVFRPIPSRVPSLQELNLPEQAAKFTKHRVGIVLVTGPKGCGKTTTLAAMIDLINSTRREHVITVEDPIEFIHPCKKGHVNQRQVGTHTESFSNALRSALREAPDVIMVGEMRDLVTTSLAITAAETGHLVLATLHTPDALRTIGRVLDVFPPKEQPQIRAMLSESLRGIISQMLVPSLDGKSMELALEILVNTPAIGHMIREERVHQVPGLMQTGRKLGMRLMDDSLIQLVRDEKIAREDALARASESAEMERQLSKLDADEEQPQEAH